MKAVEIVALYPPRRKLAPTAGSVISVNAPPLILGDETSRTPPSKPFWKLKELSKASSAISPMIGMFGVSRRLSLMMDGSSTKALLGELRDWTVDVTQVGVGPMALEAVHPAGKAGAVTPSKF